MKMRIFLQQKLWRDGAVTKMEALGSKINWRYLDDTEFDKQLRLKLLEEAEEVRVAQSHDELMSELADVTDIIDALCVLHNISKGDIVTLQHKKQAERGGFEGRKFVDTAEHSEGGFGESYCLAQPNKYPEVV